jgi:sulfur carrier protein ThiS
MIKIKTSFFGPLRRPWPEQSRELEIEDGLDVGGLMTSLGYSPEDSKRVAVVINGNRSLPATRLKAGDDVRFVLLAGGG